MAKTLIRLNSNAIIFLSNFHFNFVRSYTSTLPKIKEKQTSAEYCLESVRRYDKENYLCTLLLDNSLRNCSLAVRAFNIEVARIQDLVSEPKIGLMRFQFWDDAITALFDKNGTKKIPNHPVMNELRKITQRHKLSKRYFQRLITSRRNQLTSPVFSSLENLETYMENGVSSIYYLLLESNDIQNIHADHVASHLGKAQGLANNLRSIQHGAEQGQIFIPRDLLIHYNISEEQILRKRISKQLKDAVFDIATKANQHLEKARSLKENLPPGATPIFLPGIAVDLYLKQLRQHDFDVFSANLRKSNPILPFILWWNLKRSKF